MAYAHPIFPQAQSIHSPPHPYYHSKPASERDLGPTRSFRLPYRNRSLETAPEMSHAAPISGQVFHGRRKWPLGAAKEWLGESGQEMHWLPSSSSG